jgi:hypothetical protein
MAEETIQKPEAANLEDIQLPEGWNEKPGAIDLPVPGAGAPSLNTAESRRNALSDWGKKATTAARNPLMQTKAQEFGAGADHHNFERYYNMPRVYKKLGFTPFRDNEAAYNAESNMLDEVGRASGQWANLAGLGLKDALSFGSLTDTATAAKYEKAMGIGSSSKGGLAGFTTNLYLNSGYSVGILAEVMAEEVGLALITGASMGSTAELTIPAMIARGFRAGSKLYEGFNVAKNTIRTIDALKDINKARKYFNQTLKSGGKFLNPLENTVDFMQGIDHVGDLNKLAQTSLGFSSFYKDVRNIRYAWGESGLEGGMVKNQMEKDLLAEHYDKYDRPPTLAESNDIKTTAVKAGATTGWQNVGAIYFSNKIVLDGLFQAYKPLKNLTADAVDNGMFKIFKDTKLKKGAHKVVENNWKQTLKEFKNPAKTVAVGLNYFKANIAEGLQESAQETISGAAMDHYKEEWRGDVVKGGYFASITDNLHKQTTAEGLEVFMSGFLMGGMIAPMASTLGSFVPGSKQQSFLKDSWTKFKDPNAYETARDKEREDMEKTATTLNELWDQVGERLAPDLENLVAQNKYADGMAEATQEGNAKAFYDFKDQAQYKHIFTALKTGKFDTFVDRLSELKGQTEEEIQADYNMTKAEYDGAIDNAVARAKKIEQRYEMAQTEFKNPFNPSRMNPRTDPDAYISELQNHKGWLEAQEQFIFLQHSFDRSLERFAGIMGEAQADTQLSKVPTSDLTNLFHIETMEDELRRTRDEIKALEGSVTRDSKKALTKAKQKEKHLQDFADKMEFLIVQPTLGGDITQLDKKNKETQSAYNKAKTAYKRYLKALAKANNDYAFNNAIDASFDKLVDAYMLNDESGKLNEAINKMIDPGTFTRQAARNAEVEKLKKDNEQKMLRDSLEAYAKAKKGNDLLSLIYDLGMFFDPEEYQALINDGALPTKFYYTNDDPNGTIEEVEENSEDFTAAMNIVTRFVPEVMDIPLSKSGMERAKDAYNNETREKLDNDKRTYRDLAEQYGFNPEAKEAKVPLKAVLKSVVDSEYATPSEILLAKQLLRRAGDAELVTFVNDAENPGTYSTTTQTIIDARYSSFNIQGGTMPLEFVILHEEIHRRTVEELKNDPEFLDNIVNIQTAVSVYLNKNAPKEPLLYGMSDPAEFVAEAMSNPIFQALLAEVPYQATGKSAWAEFVDSVLKMLKKVMGGKKYASGTALNEALHIITAKIDQTYGVKDGKVTKTKPGKKVGKKKSTGIPTAENTKVTKSMKIPELVKEHPVLAANLLAYYKDLNATREIGPLDPDYADKTDDQILGSVIFGNTFKGPNKAIQGLIDDYNKATGRTEEPLLKATSRSDKGTAIIAKLTELGYSDEEISNMSVPDAEEIANDGMSKEERESSDAATARAEEQMDAETAIDLIRQIEAFIAGATTYDELYKNNNSGKKAIMALLDSPAYTTINSPDGWTILLPKAQEAGENSIGPVIENLLTAREKEIAFTVKLEDIVPGEQIVLKSGAKMVIDQVVDGAVLAHKAGKPEKISEFTLDQIKFTTKAAQAKVKPDSTDITPEDNKKQDETDTNLDELDDTINEDATSEEDDEDFEIC